MAKRLWLAALAVAAAACGGATTATSVLDDAQGAMGNPTTIQYSGTGMNAFFGQALTAGEAWPRRDLTKYTKTINYEQNAARDEMTFAQPVFGGQQQTQVVNGDRAWNVGPQGPVPQLAAAEERRLHIILTPHGFLRAARAAGNASLGEGEGDRTISFTALDKYPVSGTINAQNQVTRVATTIGNPVLGDTELVATYSNYRNFDGVQFPGRIEMQQGGFPLWELDITGVSTNASLDAAVPQPVAAATIAPVQTMSAQLAPGVWHVTGGSHHSVVVELADYSAIVEAPLNEERALAVLAEARRLVPNKPVRYVITTHHHFDHTGGLRAMASEGVTIVTHQANVPYFEKVLAAPATIVPDAQGRNTRTPAFEAVAAKHTITDGKQTIEVYPTGGDTHTDEYTHVYLPGPRILVEADAWSPGPADAPIPDMPPPNAVRLYEEIQNLKLNVATIAPIHGRGAVPLAELRRFVRR